jgi:radical SAM superfamily enzyme YgiQ (UPF0313 family)/predicted O-methyltransferase YrrM/GT2 family glycosyltransferase
MKNFLLINPHYHIRHPPLGLGYLASYITAYYPQRYRFRLVDYAWQTDRDLEIALQEFPPDLVGLGATTNTFLEAQRIAGFIKSRVEVPIILGGVHITAVPEDLLNSPFEVAVLGEGEETLLELLRYFDETGSLANENIPGLAFQQKENLVKTPVRPLIADLDRVPPPDYSLLAMREHYTRAQALAHGFYAKGTSLMPSRGCPYGDCSFCGSSLMWQRRVRFFSPRRVFAEIKNVVETYGLNSVIFLDDNFTTNRGWLAELAGYIRESDFFPYFKFDCESIAEFLDEEKARLLKSMGCERVEFGFESGCQRVLAELKNSKVKLSKSIEAINLCQQSGLKILGNFIFGWFDETPEEILETYDFTQQHPIDYVAWHTLAPYPGTRAWGIFLEQAERLRPGFNPRDFYNMETCNTHLHLNPALDPAQTVKIYNKMRQEAYQTNIQMVHDLNLAAAEKEELWQAFEQDMQKLQVAKPRIVLTQPNARDESSGEVPETGHEPRPAPARALPQEDEGPERESLASLCRRLEKDQPLSTREILADFGLLTGHPWEHHANSPVTTYYACLAALAQSCRPRRILEIGTGFGLSAAALLHACDQVELFVSLDLGIFADEYQFKESNLAFAARKIHAWCQKRGVPPERVRFFRANTQPLGKTDNDNIACQASHWSTLLELRQVLAPASFDVLFVDGKHTEDGLYQDMRTFWRFLRPGGLLLCDDLHDDSYREIFPWAGETIASFERFLGEFASDIAEHQVWPFPQVLPEGAAGLRPFGLIRKKEATAPEARKVAYQPAPVDPVDLTPVLTDLARANRRLYFRDQTPASLAALVALAEEFQPTCIVELGTCQGLSLRAWLAARTPARITTIDLSMAPLRQSLETVPMDLSRVTLLEQNILETDFSRLWDSEDRVLLYVDAHDQPQAPLMDYILKKALPALPPGSLVVVDDLWHSDAPLNPETVEDFFRSRVLPEIDPLQCFPGHYASYWQGGAFMGFAEAIPLLTWVNQQRLELRFSPEAKLVSFGWPPQETLTPSTATPDTNPTDTGTYYYHPVENFALAGAGGLNLDRGTFAALSRYLEGMDRFGQGKIQEALGHFEAAGDCPALAGAGYAQAVCSARLGNLEDALRRLESEPAGTFIPAQAVTLRRDIQYWLGETDVFSGKPELVRKEPSLTIFAIPKAFRGHTAIIQKNALESWTRLKPRPEIILFGRDPGTAEIARELNLRHVPEVALSDHGTPLVNDLFQQAEALAPTGTLAYVNADIILGQDFLDAAAAVQKDFSRFLMVGRRWDLDLAESLNFDDPDWHAALRRRVEREASLHVVSALDYFVFSKGLWPKIPNFSLGRTAWDNWLVAQPLTSGVAVVDATPAVLAVHQNHDYHHVGGGKEAAWRGEEARRNQELGWESPFLCYSSHATWELKPSGLAERPREAQALAAAWKGVALLAREDFSGALAKFRATLDLMPEGIPGLQYLLALALAGLDRRDEAIQALRTELASHPSHHPAARLLGGCEPPPESRVSFQPRAATGPDRPLISVVTPTHNRAGYVAEAVNTALSQEFHDLEVVVVDDGSTDDTAEVLAQITDPRFRYIQKPKTNAPDTRNQCIAAARGEFLLWLDSDDLLLPGWLARLGSILEAGAKAEVYYGNLEVVDARRRRLNIIRYEDFANKNALLLARLVQGNPLPLPGSLIRKTLLEEVGGFDVEFTRAHDYELWTRLALQARFRHVPFLAVQWRWHDSNMSSGSVNRDLSFDARVVQGLLTRHPLKDLFLDLPWEEDWSRAQAQAAHQLADIFSRYGDSDRAREWLAESQELGPGVTVREPYAAGL